MPENPFSILEASDLEDTHPPNPSTVTKKCSVKVIPPRSLSRQYSEICTTHRKLVQSGKIQCSVSLSESPDTVNLPSAPSSPFQEFPQQLEGSVHWGAVGEFSGVQTPAVSPAVRISVIETVPPALPPRGIPVPSPTPLPPKSAVPQPRTLQKQTSPSLLQGISTLLKCLPADIYPLDCLDQHNQHYQETPVSSKAAAILPRRLSSTDPHLLDNRKIPIVSTSVSSLESSSEVFLPNQPQTPIIITQQQETRALVHQRRLLMRELDDFTEDDVCASRLPVLETDLAEIKKLRNQYQDNVEDYMEKYSNMIDDQEGLEKWRRDVIQVGRDVKNHARRIRDRM